MKARKALLTILLLGVSSALLAAPAAERAEVAIRNRRYVPATLRVPVGTRVVWTNYDELDHTVVAEDGSFSSPTLKNGATYGYTFRQKGNFAYGCRLHPRMRGTVVVE